MIGKPLDMSRWANRPPKEHQCHDCGGIGQRRIGHSMKDGVLYMDCCACNGSGDKRKRVDRERVQELLDEGSELREQLEKELSPMSKLTEHDRKLLLKTRKARGMLFIMHHSTVEALQKPLFRRWAVVDYVSGLWVPGIHSQDILGWTFTHWGALRLRRQLEKAI